MRVCVPFGYPIQHGLQVITKSDVCSWLEDKIGDKVILREVLLFLLFPRFSILVVVFREV